MTDTCITGHLNQMNQKITQHLVTQKILIKDYKDNIFLTNVYILQTYQNLGPESSTPPKMPTAEIEETISNTKTWTGLSPLVLLQQRTEESNTRSTLFNDDEDVATIHYNQVKMSEADLSQSKKQCV